MLVFNRMRDRPMNRCRSPIARRWCFSSGPVLFSQGISYAFLQCSREISCRATDCPESDHTLLSSASRPNASAPRRHLRASLRGYVFLRHRSSRLTSTQSYVSSMSRPARAIGTLAATMGCGKPRSQRETGASCHSSLSTILQLANGQKFLRRAKHCQQILVTGERLTAQAAKS